MKNQNGVGLMEVIIALLLLAISVLGYSLLQYRSLEVAGQALKKVEAMNLARNLGERMYVNKVAYSEIYKSGLSKKGRVEDCKYKNDTKDYCTFANFAKKDLADVAKLAENKNMKVDILPCPATGNGRSCIYVAWDETLATQSDDNDNSACTNVEKFTYKAKAKCIVVEAY